jgi:hypothetical protein
MNTLVQHKNLIQPFESLVSDLGCAGLMACIECALADGYDDTEIIAKGGLGAIVDSHC